MNDIDIRCKQLRNHLNLSQTDFGAKIGVEYSVIRNIENGITSLERKPKLCNLICRIFNVNEKWLKYGTGEMFTESSEINELSSRYSLSDVETNILKNYLAMDENERKTFTNMLVRLTQNSSDSEETSKTNVVTPLFTDVVQEKQIASDNGIVAAHSNITIKEIGYDDNQEHIKTDIDELK